MLETVRRRRLFRPDGRLLAAVSGGADSTALLAALATLRDAGELGALDACHVDHQLRAGSAEDGDFCEGLCASLGVALQREKVVVAPGENVQAAARRARYRALYLAADRVGAEHVATAHTRSDQAETVIHRLLRGSGARGLGGIPARRSRVVRPLLDCSRDDVLGYLRDRRLGWREDPSNASTRFLRNRIRHEILPALQALAPGVERRLARTADLLREDDRALERAARRTLAAGAPRVAVAALGGQPAAVGRRVVRRLWLSAHGSRRGLEARHVEAVLRLARSRAPRRIALPSGLEARVGYGFLEIGVRVGTRAPLATVVVSGPGTYRVPGSPFAFEVRWDRAASAPWPLELRSRRPGDRFHPREARGGKKLKAWLIDRKVPRSGRDGLVVLADPKGRVLAIPQLGALAREAAGLEIVLHPDAVVAD